MLAARSDRRVAPATLARWIDRQCAPCPRILRRSFAVARDVESISGVGITFCDSPPPSAMRKIAKSSFPPNTTSPGAEEAIDAFAVVICRASRFGSFSGATQTGECAPDHRS